MGLNICMLCAEQLACAAAGDILNNIDTLAAAVIALSGISLGILIGQNRSHCGKHSRRYDVFACDKLYVAALTGQLCIHG